VVQAAIKVEDDTILLKTAYQNRVLAKSVQGARWDRRRKVWTYPLSPYTAIAIENIFGVSIPELEKLVDAYNNLKIDDAEPQSKTVSWHHQIEAYNKCVALWENDLSHGFLLGFDMGCGKSKTAIDLINHVKARRVFIMCPLSVVPVWPEEFLKHSHMPYNVVPLEDGSVAERMEQAKSEMARGVPTVLVMNFEAMWRDPMRKFLLDNKWDVVIADEVHRLKSPGGKASRFAALLRDRATYRLGLTGTPMPHSPMDLYAQYRFMDHSVFGTSFTSFKARYAVMGGYQGYQVVGYRNEQEMHNRMMSVAHIVKADDVQDLPDVVHQTRYCTLGPKAMKVYERLEEDFYAEVEAGEITVSNALVKLLRLQQITSGYMRTDDGEEHEIDTNKANALRDIFEDLSQDEPVVVFCKFHADLDKVHEIAEQCGRTSCELSGRRKELEQWQQGCYNVLAAQIQAGSVGVSFVRARVQVYYSLGFSLGDYQQSLKRIHRPGQNDKVLYIHIVARRTVDQDVYKALQKKRDVVEFILRGLDT
jgi:SNF2 family DNA or RNA helicase